MTPSNPGARRVPGEYGDLNKPRAAGAAAPQRGTGPAVTRKRSGRRTACGVIWAFYTVVLVIAGFALLGSGSIGSGFIALALAALAGWYDYRVWTFKTKWLNFLIIF